jgi:hypothetical protein
MKEKRNRNVAVCFVDGCSAASSHVAEIPLDGSRRNKMASNGIFLSPGKFLSTCWKYKRNKTRNEITEKRETNEKKRANISSTLHRHTS